METRQLPPRTGRFAIGCGGTGWEVIEIAANQLDDMDAMTRHLRRLAGYLGNSQLREAVRADRSWFSAG